MMPQTQTLSFTGHAGLPVPHEFFRQDAPTNHLAVFLPGYAYSCDMPLFYYAETLLLDFGSDLLRLAYAYNLDPGFLHLPPAARLARLLADAIPALAAALAQRPYTRLTLIAKSLGTLALPQLLAIQALPPDTRAVWLTPLLSDPSVLATIRTFPGPHLIAIGTADPDYDSIRLTDLAQTPATTVLTIPNADHSLDIPGNTLASIATLATVITALRSLFDPHPSERTSAGLQPVS